MCPCRQCVRERDAIEKPKWPTEATTFIVCATCGCKRCPHATDHRLVCTDSNEPGQQGSIYGVPLESQYSQFGNMKDVPAVREAAKSLI